MFALVHDGIVRQIEEKPFDVCSDFIWVDVSSVDPQPVPGWTAVQKGKKWKFTEAYQTNQPQPAS